VAGNPITYQGDITLFGGSGIHTNAGGSIQMLTPGGSQTFGIEGAAPPSTAGVITQGSGISSCIPWAASCSARAAS
jgi:hypothetical protein